MKKILNPFRRLSAYSSTRRGSMLIMVIVILVLLALIGTAMISTSRVDRLSVVQHSENTQIDLLVQSVKDISVAAIRDALFGRTLNGQVYKASADQSTAAPSLAYKPYTSAEVDAYLAARIPSVVDDSASASAGNLVFWKAITSPLLGNTVDAPGLASPVSLPLAKNAYRFVPTSAAFAGRAAWPHIQIYADLTGTGSYTTLGSPIPAADTDGDGIADALFFKLPVGQLSGVTYYAAVRIIDNNSAINVATAIKPNDDFITEANGQVPGNFFPTNVDLLNFLGGTPAQITAQVTALNLYKSGGAAPSNIPIDDTGLVRSDFRFISPYDSYWMQLGRRLKNPGYNTAGVLYTGLSDSDAMALAYPFGIFNRSLSPTNLSTVLLPNSLGGKPTIGAGNAPTAPYQPSDTINWYNQIYDFANIAPAARTTRPLTVVQNGVSSTAPPHKMVDDGQTPVSLCPGLFLNVSSQPNGMAPYAPNTAVPKVSINTAQFPELWRGFWNVMCEQPNTAPFPNPLSHLENGNQTAHMFSSVYRPPALAVGPPAVPTSFEMMQLRAAIAAVQAMDMRDADDDVTSRRVVLCNYDTTTKVSTPTYSAMVFGTERQPYITEVYTNTNSADAGPGGEAPNPKGYVAIELYNPYPTDLILTNWTLGLIDRRDSTTYPLKMRPISWPASPTVTALPFTSAVRIPANGYLVLENLNKTGTPNAIDANYRPATATVSVTAPLTTFMFVPNLSQVFEDTVDPTQVGGELVLLRPRRADGTLTASTVVGNEFNETNAGLDPTANSTAVINSLTDMVPVDSYDFTNIKLEAAPAGKFYRTYYARPNLTSNPPSSLDKSWKFVYPGKYTVASLNSRHEISDPLKFSWSVSLAETEASLAALSPTPNLGGSNSTGTYGTGSNLPGIQLNNRDMAGPNGAAPYQSSRQYVSGDVVTYNNLRYQATATPPTVGTAPLGTGWVAVLAADNSNRFPFGGFARNADMLQIPYIGAYRLRASGLGDVGFTEMNTVTMDSLFAEDGDAAALNADDFNEQLGKFCPMGVGTALAGATSTYYDWASDLFDFFTVLAPNDDYLPNVSPAATDVTSPLNPTTYRFGNPPTYPLPVGVRNIAFDTAPPSVTNTATEYTAPVEGLININTAPWFVLARLPFVPPGTDAFGVNASTGAFTAGANGVDDNIEIAKLIVGWRDGNSIGYGVGHGPFKTLFDLNKIIAPLPADQPLGATFGKTFQNCFGTLVAAADPDDADGDLSPFNLTVVAANLAAIPPVSVEDPHDGVREDVEEKYLMLNRISNMITTRSDSFTVYIQLQGWRNVSGGVGLPELAVQRRASMIVDRTNVTKTSDLPTITNVPTN